MGGWRYKCLWELFFATLYTVKYKLGDEVKDTEVVTIPVGTTVHKNVEIG